MISPVAVRNTGGVPFLALQGQFVIRANQQPDGDTVAFTADRPYPRTEVETNVPVDPTGARTTPLRLQSIDAVEKAQPEGATARDALLRLLGFPRSIPGLTATTFKATGPTLLRPGWIVTHGMDINRRPLSYLFTRNPGFTHGALVTAARVLAAIKQSANLRLTTTGAVFPAFYANTDELHAALFRTEAVKARDARRGVWAVDATLSGFVPTATALSAAGGALVYPKYYRRVAQWGEARPSASAFIAWLRTQDDGQKLVTGANRRPLPLWQLFERLDRSRVVVPYDVTRLRFSE